MSKWLFAFYVWAVTCLLALMSMRNAKKGFKEVLNRIHKRTPGSRLNKTTDM